MTDTIADMLTRIRNAQRARKTSVAMPYSKLKQAIAEILAREGYIGTVEKTTDTKPELVIGLKYNGLKPMIQEITRLSKPGHRMYRAATELPTVLNGYGFAIVSTSRGLMTAAEAKKLGVGGEVLCSIY